MSDVGPLLNLGSFVQPATSAGGHSGGGPPAGVTIPGASIEQVLVLMLLHITTAVACVVLLTTLTRTPERRFAQAE